ncbi:MAG: glycosyltransferase family 4 protein [Geminicoccaceae bacterium]
MHIRHLVDTSGFGGIESHLALLLPALASRGHDAHLWFLKDHGHHRLAEYLAEERIVTEALDGRLSSLIGRLRARPADILHTHGYKAGILGRLAGLVTRTPVVSTFHNGDSGEGRVAVYTALDRLSALFSRNIAVSREIEERLARAVVIPNFVTCPADPPARRDVERIAFVGRLAPIKGPDRFLELARETGACATIFGDGALRAELEAAAPANVAFAGHVADMRPHWRDIGLLVMTSRAEGLPLAALEAMAAGVPVAAFGHGALPDVIDHGKNGFLAETDDLDGLLDHVRRWLGMPADEQVLMSAAAHAKIARCYALSNIVPRIEAVYAQTASGERCDLRRSAELISSI